MKRVALFGAAVAATVRVAAALETPYVTDGHASFVTPRIECALCSQAELDAAAETLRLCYMEDRSSGMVRPFFKPGACPSGSNDYGGKWWSLDYALAVEGAKWLDFAIGEDLVTNLCAVIRPDGRMKLYSPDWSKTVNGKRVFSSSLPKFLETVPAVARMSAKREVREQALSLLERNLAWWYANRQDRETKLVTAFFEETFVPNTDLGPDEYAPLDTNFEIAIGSANAADLAELLGRPEKARAFRAKADEIAAAVAKYCRDPRDGLFRPYLVKERRLVRTDLASTFLAFRLPAAARDDRLMAALKGGDFGWDRLPLCSASRKDPRFNVHDGDYRGNLSWLGGVWTLHNDAVIRALRAGGENAAADELARKTVAAFRGNYAEFLNPDSGRGNGMLRYAWTASQFIRILFEELFGLSYTPEGGLVCKPAAGFTGALRGLRLPDGRTVDVVVSNGSASGVRDRVTCLEAWAKRQLHDFTREGAELVKRAGFTGVFLNGASGFGPDQISLALAGETKALPRLAPYTCRANDRELHERAAVLDAAKLDKWWCLWGIPGPHLTGKTDLNFIYRTLDWRMKAEMKAELERNPEIFGKRVPGKGSWRGSRPLCLSHPRVRAFYREAWRNAVKEYGLKGLVFFPGDDDPECCDETCERCRAGGKDGFALLIALANEMMEIARGIRADFEMDFVVWNNGHGRLDRFLKELDPRIGIAMSHSDQLTVPRAAGEIWYNQPWANFGAKGDRFAAMAKRARAAGRPVMSIGEIAQSEVWDPLHNMPNPRETIRLLRGAAEENAAVMDFWGERRPFTPHANFAAMRAYLADPAADDRALLDRAARDHYAIAAGDGETLRLAREAWAAFERADRSSSLVAWTQRFSPGIGRDRARGRLFCALTPALFAEIEGKGYRCWPYRQVAAAVTNTAQFLSVARGDRARFGAAADAFARLADRLEANGDRANAANARSEGDNVRLAGELYGSEARTIAAVQAYERKDAAALRALIEEELEARERELRISARLDPESGIDPLLVQEDIANMRLYLSSDGFPSVPKDRFLMNDVWYR